MMTASSRKVNQTEGKEVALEGSIMVALEGKMMALRCSMVAMEGKKVELEEILQGFILCAK